AAFAKGEGRDTSEAVLRDGSGAALARVESIFRKQGGKEKVSTLRQEMNTTMEDGAGIYRTEETLTSTAKKIDEVRARYAEVNVADKTSVFNTDLIYALELGAMLDVSQTVAHSALHRKESRGSHQRLDFEKRDDVNYLKHSMAHYDGKGNPKIDYLDVVITKSQPAARVYGGAAEK
ncbi:MAG: succinate dehydrogenase/fumarate reductase flavoprotein subunit, partial [Alphaproteobacteria bacterium]|nr:succinate dehydrogenase/fumarate reductase flavoprotein subunit [Alphaproteobacteria bacterium]